MKLTVIGYMKSHLDDLQVKVSNETMPLIKEELKRFSGAEAGICYMSKPYFDSYVTDKDKALNRFTTVSGTGHHSIAGHAQVAVLLEGIPKIVAMYLNNLGCYETSEKSGRYTVMTGNNPKEVELYDKWCKIFQDRIVEEYGDKVDERTRVKLAQENARYILSVFTPTTMGYTTSLRQWNYIIDWSEKFATNEELPNNYFFNELKGYFKELSNIIKEVLYVEELRDFKNRVGLDMIEPITCGLDDIMEIDINDIEVGKTYCLSYFATPAMLAQAQRHRTLNYTMYFDGNAKLFYIPEIIRDTKYATEWLHDITSVSEFVPNGTLVKIEESGLLENFYLKTMERHCGRAQLEIEKVTLESAERLYEYLDEVPEHIRDRVFKFYNKNGNPKMKGQLLKCKEPCVWGCEGSKLRKI